MDVDDPIIGAQSEIESDDEIFNVSRKVNKKRCNLSESEGEENIPKSPNHVPSNNSNIEARSPRFDHDLDTDSNSSKSSGKVVQTHKSRIKIRLNELSSSDDDVPTPKRTFFISKQSKSKHKDDLLSQVDEFKERLFNNIADSDTDDQKNHNTRKVKEKIHAKFKKLKEKVVEKEKLSELCDDESSESDKDNKINHNPRKVKEKIRDKFKKLKEKITVLPEEVPSNETMGILNALCDDESSESDKDKLAEEPTYQRVRKYTKKERSPNVVKEKRMSSKEAKENIKIILSESNRRLREKQVTLPYHRPKQRSLKDILNRKRPIMGSDGKSLPIRMNKEQLTQYAHQLEERQKEIVELYKSESESEEEVEENDNKHENIENDSCDKLPSPGLGNNLTETEASVAENATENLEHTEIESDLLFDTIVNESMKTIDDSQDDAMNVDSDSEMCDKNTANNKGNTNTNRENIDANKEKTDTHKENAVTNAENIDKNRDDTDTYRESSDTNRDVTDTDRENIDSIKESPDTNREVTDTNMETTDANRENIDTNNETLIKNIEYSGVENKEEKNNDQIGRDNDDNSKTIEMNSVRNVDNSNHSSEDNNDSMNVTEITESEDIHLVYNTENTETNTEKSTDCEITGDIPNKSSENVGEITKERSDDKDFDEDDFDKLLEEAFNENFSDVEMAEEAVDESESTVQPKQEVTFNPALKPKIGGYPGAIINLDSEESTAIKKLTGLDKLRQRFFYFTKIKTAEEIERENQKKIKPGTHHQKLKAELAQQIAEQRAQEWAKRLQESKQKLDETKTELSDCEEAIEESEKEICEIGDKSEANETIDESETSEEEPCEENDVDLTDKKKKKSLFIEDEAEVSEDETESDDETSSESEEESEINEKGVKKSRILKAFEDSDDEEKAADILERKSSDLFDSQATPDVEISLGQINNSLQSTLKSPKKISSPLRQTQINTQVEMDALLNFCSGKFSTQQVETAEKNHLPLKESETLLQNEESHEKSIETDEKLDKSIENPTENLENTIDSLENPIDSLENASESLENPTVGLANPIETVEDEDQLNEDILQKTNKSYENLADISIEGIPEEKNEKKINSIPDYVKDLVDSGNTPDICEELLDMCTGKFTGVKPQCNDEVNKMVKSDENRSFLDTLLNDSDGENHHKNRFFKSKEGRMVVSSDEEEQGNDRKRRKKRKRRKDFERRKLQISDDEDESENNVYDEECSEASLEEELNENVDKIVEYDSEENEVEVEISTKKMKKMATKFFENEAELTSEDEWAGSADEDERGLDRFEREAGDADELDMDDVQKQVYRTHMREIMDQDKREVRLIQEILLEDGDLGGDQRQRKFRWRNTDDGFDAATAGPLVDGDDFEELESEELWRRQRHERQLFLNSQQDKEKEPEILSITRNSIIKANLNSKTMSSMLLEAKSPNLQQKSSENDAVCMEKKIKDIPSPIKSGPLSIMQNMVNRSLLSRSSLARLAAIADPLADAPTPNFTTLANNGKNNFVFATLTPRIKDGGNDGNKVTKRKAELDVGTPKLIKKLKRDDKPKRSFLQHVQH